MRIPRLSKRRATARVLGVLVLASTMVGFGSTSPASAAVVDLACVGTETVTFSPPLTNTAKPTTVTVVGNLPTCLVNPALQPVTYNETITNTLSCVTVNAPGSGTRTFHYVDATTSTFAYNKTSSNVLGNVVVTFTGGITAGRFTTDTTNQVITQLNLNPLLCLTTGVPSTVGAVTLAALGI